LDSFISSFSFVKSGKELIKFDKKNELNSLNGLKFMLMILILFGHRGMFLAGNPLNYPKIFENVS